MDHCRIRAGDIAVYFEDCATKGSFDSVRPKEGVTPLRMTRLSFNSVGYPKIAGTGQQATGN